ncbi:MAG TPA: helix-turn-helix transcriptional regulator [Firmicutes bacterium]|nr:helix-turn-helix transcriptional regulator [Bacillota bacterium]
MAPDLTSKEFWKHQINLGLSRFFLLMVLCRSPRHAYAAVQELRSMTSGCCTPTLATVYPLLAEMERGGYLESRPDFTGARRRRVYRLTPRGEQAYQAAVAAWAEVVPLVQRALEGEQQIAEVKQDARFAR